MEGRMNLNSISIILVRPRFHENIGSVARAMKNMGVNRLMVVDGCSPLHVNAYRLASGAEDILERSEEFPTLREAISEMGSVIGTTSRGGKGRSPLLTPRILFKKLAPLTGENSMALVFGSEKEGLTNEELSLCHYYVRIPASEAFPSLNLAQAVIILCYELFQSSMRVERRPIRLAKAEEMERMLEHMERTLLDIGFLNPKNPKRLMGEMKRLFGRSEMEEKEVRIFEGIWSKIDWQMRGGKRRGQ